MSPFIRLQLTFLHIYYTTFKPLTCQICSGIYTIYSSHQKLLAAQNPPNIVWRLGSAKTRWGAYSAHPDPLAGLRGAYWLILWGEGKGREGKGRGIGDG